MARNSLFVLAAAWITLTAVSQAGTLRKQFSYSSVNQPADLVISDFNRDGKADVAVVEDEGRRLLVFLGNGAGSLSLYREYPLPDSAERIAAGDLNRDGNVDFVISWRPSSLVVFLGSGDGTFQIGGSIKLAAPFSGPVAVADLNRDGIVDIAAGCGSSSASLAILLGNGDGTFRGAVYYPAFFQPWGIAAGDFNGDSIPDLAVACTGSSPSNPLRPEKSVIIFIGSGDGKFRALSPINFAPTPTKLISGDFNGDGRTDLALGTLLDQSVFVLYGNGDGTFRTAQMRVDSYCMSVASGDFDGNNLPDLLCGQIGISVFRNNGPERFAAPIELKTSTYIRAMAAGDMNGDGKADLVILMDTPHAVEVHLQVPLDLVATVAADRTESTFGDPVPVRMSATLKPVLTALSGPEGTVSWVAGGVSLGSANLTVRSDGAGYAELQVYPPAGVQSVSIRYTGADNLVTAGSVTVSVARALPVVALSVSPVVPSVNDKIRVSVRVSQLPPRTGLPTGSVVLKDGAETLGSFALDAAGVAQADDILLAAGLHNLSASYPGDRNFLAAGATLAVNIAPARATVSIACSPSPAARGERIVCRADVAPSGATGTIALRKNNSVAGEAALDGGRAAFELAGLEPGTYDVRAEYSGNAAFGAAVSRFVPVVVLTSEPIAVLTSANGAAVISPDGIASIYGDGFTLDVISANQKPLPQSLSGITVAIVDSTGMKATAPLFFVSPRQINFLVPAVAPGPARIEISNGTTVRFAGPASIDSVAPGLFSATADGAGPPAGFRMRIDPDGNQILSDLFVCERPGSCVPAPISIGSAPERNYLILFGSGLRHATQLTVEIGGRPAEVSWFGAHPQYEGLDQVNVRVPPELAGAGEVTLTVSADSKEANRLILVFR